MANLIITIISIALVAVAAIMGAYYGGAAFQEAQAKSMANAILSQGQQITAAMHVWWAQNSLMNNEMPAWDGYSYTSTLIPSYLSQMPIGPDLGRFSYNTGWGLAYTINSGGSINHNLSYSRMSVGDQIVGSFIRFDEPTDASALSKLIKVCEAFSRSAGFSGIPQKDLSSDGITSVFGDAKHVCFDNPNHTTYTFMVRM